ncbi:hypothetical protein ACOMHN_009598 [Nucella lapillus]
MPQAQWDAAHGDISGRRWSRGPVTVPLHSGAEHTAMQRLTGLHWHNTASDTRQEKAIFHPDDAGHATPQAFSHTAPWREGQRSTHGGLGVIPVFFPLPSQILQPRGPVSSLQADRGVGFHSAACSAVIA